MNVEEVVKLADNLVFAKTGQYLDDLQKAILYGTLQGKKYTQIAEEKHCNDSYVRDLGAKLWQLFSEELGEKVTKSNFRSSIERCQIKFSHFAQDYAQIGSVTICGDTIQNQNSSADFQSHFKKTPSLHHNLSEMPNLGKFYNRTSELQSLKTLIFTEKAQILTIIGIIGIGKTALITKLVQEIKHQFEYVIWRSLETCPTVAQMQNSLKELFSEQVNSKSRTNLTHLLQKHRTLIILDDIHCILSKGQLSGQYESGYEDYRVFFKQIRDLSHQSCLILIGWEVPRDLAQMNYQNIHHFILNGLDISSAQKIISEQGLEPEGRLKSLIENYQGNPLWLKTVSNFILDLGLAVTNVLQYQPFLLPEDLKYILQQPLDRLSEIELEVLFHLVREEERNTLEQLLETINMPYSNLLDILQSLCRRNLVEKKDNIYIISPVLREFLIQKL